MPLTAIPARGRALEATVYGGNNGVGLHALYATKNLTVLNVSVQRGFLSTDSRAYDLGIGKVFKDDYDQTKMMVLFTYGFGHYIRYPFIQSGGRGEITAIRGDVYRTSIYVNRPFAQRNGLIARLSNFWGSSSQDRYLEPDLESVAFNAIGIETSYYRLLGKRKHVILGLGCSLTSGRRKNGRLKEFIACPGFLFLGYHFAKA